jgi:hypothetical protein
MVLSCFSCNKSSATTKCQSNLDGNNKSKIWSKANASVNHNSELSSKFRNSLM